MSLPTSDQWIAVAAAVQAVTAVAIWSVTRATLKLQREVERSRATADVLPEIAPGKVGPGGVFGIWLVNASGSGVLLERLLIDVLGAPGSPIELHEFNFLNPKPGGVPGNVWETTRVLMPASRNELGTNELQKLLRSAREFALSAAQKGPDSNPKLTIKLSVFYQAQGRRDQRSASYQIEADVNGFILRAVRLVV